MFLANAQISKEGWNSYSGYFYGRSGLKNGDFRRLTDERGEPDFQHQPLRCGTCNRQKEKGKLVTAQV